MSPPTPSFRQTWNDSIELDAGPHAGRAVYRYSPAQPKPCVHPLTTPAGHVLSGFQMSDHIWHRGLWFTIKLINESNFWEENPPFGAQATEVQPACTLLPDGAMRILHELTWKSDATGPVLAERRTITFRTDRNGIGTIDWSNELSALQNLKLDRTPFTTWGGYGGLAFRTARQMHKVNFMIPGGETSTAIPGHPHDWVVLQGQMDGSKESLVSLGMIDHPSNPRSPSPWYGKSSADGFNFLNAAFLFHEPMSLSEGKSLRMNYRVMYRDGTWSADEFAAAAKAFRESEAGA